MTNLSDTMQSLDVRPGSLAIFWLGQAGFAFKTSGGAVIYLDAYLSNMCETTLGGGITAKRIMPPPIASREIVDGYMFATHSHQDHLDEEAISIIAEESPGVQFGGPICCTRVLKRLGVPPNRIHLLEEGKENRFDEFSIRAVYADHGPDEPDAVGIVLESDGIRVYHTGDTCYCPEHMEKVIGLAPDIIIPCINGTFGNLDAFHAALLANDVGAKVAIPCHFWFFLAQNTKAEGMPIAFIESCKTSAPNTTPVILTVSEPYIFTGACALA